MKFIIGVDLEGLACVVGQPGGTINDSRDLAFAKRQGVREANAAARALFDSGAEQVIIWDNHNGSLNLDCEAIDPRCDIAVGVGFPHRWPGLDESFAGVLFVGYHSKDNTPDAPICHTFSSKNNQWIKINGEEVGEMAVDAAIAGEHGVPPLFVSSDDKAIAEAQHFFPGITTVTTKQGFGWNAAISKHPQRVVDEIYEAVKQAVANREQMSPFHFKSPLEFEIRFKRIEPGQSRIRSNDGWEQVDAYTVRRRAERITDLY